jgi:hypothetical protein
LTRIQEFDKLQVTIKKGYSMKAKFLIGWIEGSSGACGDKTGIHTQDDLLKGYLEGNHHVNAFDIEGPEDYLWDIGAAKAFLHNWTAIDSFTIVIDEKNNIILS